MYECTGKVFIEKILPESVSKVLFLDTDVVVTQEFTMCFPPFGERGYLGMALDMGEVCQLDPDKCWPMSHYWKVPAGLTCGTSSSRAARLRDKFNAHNISKMRCPLAGQKEPLTFNGGVLWLYLDRMREVQFSERIINYTHHTARMTGPEKVPVTWGEQEFLNNYLRFQPDALVMLPCGCNYQWTATRREVKCPSQPVAIGHGWHDGVASQGRDPFNRYVCNLSRG